MGSLPASTTFYVNPNSGVAQWVTANPSNPNEPLIAKDIASQPQATWYTTYNPATIKSHVSYTHTGETIAAHDPFDTGATVPAGSSMSFGMQGIFTASDAVPTSFTLTANNGQTVTCTAG